MLLHCLGGQLWHLQQGCEGDATANHQPSDLFTVFTTRVYSNDNNIYIS